MAGVFGRALTDTFKQCGGAAGIMLLIAGPCIGWAILGFIYGRPVMEAEWQYLITGLAGIGAVFLVMLAYNTFAAPYRIQRDRANDAERRAEAAEKAASVKPIPIVVEPPKPQLEYELKESRPNPPDNPTMMHFEPHQPDIGGQP